MALALKEELHRLVDEIPDSRPDIARVVFEHTLLLLPDNPDEDEAFHRALRIVAQDYLRDMVWVPTSADDAGEVPAKIRALRDKWVHEKLDIEPPLPRILAEAPEDDEPLTPEEIEMLDARIQALATTPAIPHEEVLRRLRS